MRLKTKTTLRGYVGKESAVWPKGSIFDDEEIGPIPELILEEVKQNTGTVEIIKPGKLKGEAKSSPSTKSKPKPKTKKKAKAKASSSVTNKPKAKAKPKSAKRKRKTL